jgi:hypothetical protein
MTKKRKKMTINTLNVCLVNIYKGI